MEIFLAPGKARVEDMEGTAEMGDLLIPEGAVVGKTVEEKEDGTVMFNFLDFVPRAVHEGPLRKENLGPGTWGSGKLR
jgi:hypothetical protein